ncbi:ester cyclase [Desulfobacula sp.]|uniref:ester cyclase n=1 Tax=Desulfobacula sp. TaxID=2593537 RepID=UPI0026308F9A|nr:ester cyclase [Desulfobacula sp.]
MAVIDNATVARTFHEAWAKRDPYKGMKVIADDCEFIDIPRNEIQHGPEGYLNDYKRWRTAFPDGTVEITNIIVQEEWVVVEYTNSGTNTGPLKTVIGDFPPSNRKIKVKYCSVMKIKDGKVIRGYDYYDSNTILHQLGVLNIDNKTL